HLLDVPHRRERSRRLRADVQDQLDRLRALRGAVPVAVLTLARRCRRRTPAARRAIPFRAAADTVDQVVEVEWFLDNLIRGGAIDVRMRGGDQDRGAVDQAFRLWRLEHT